MPHPAPTKSPITPSIRGVRLRSYAALVFLLTVAIGFFAWHYGPRNRQPSDVAETTDQPNPVSDPTAIPEVPVPGSVGTVIGGTTVPARSTNVWIATHPTESPAWAVPYGQEFWRPSAPPSSPLKGDTNAAPFNIGEVVERVSHAFAPGDGGVLPTVQARVYTARLDEDAGLGFSPHRPTESQALAANVPPGAQGATGANEPPRRGLRPHHAPDRAATPQPDLDTEAWFRTVAVARDGQALFTAGNDTPQWSVLGNTAQGLLNPVAGLVAHYQARAEGVEMTWLLPQAPAGTGPLVVEAELSGLTYAGQTEHGQHYADAMGVARVRVGPVTVVDATGTHWSLSLAAAGNRLRLEVPADILSQATYPLAIDPALEAEFEMDKPVIATFGGEQTAPAVAASSSGYLVVWYDGSIGRIAGARVTTGGQISDPSGIAIERTFSASSDPAVTASSSGYLVVWSTFHVGLATDDVVGARVTTAGVVSDPDPIVICTSASLQPLPSVAASGGGYLVVWGDERNRVTTDYDIYGARVTTAGVVVDPNGLAISTAANNQSKPSVTANSSGYLVVWEDDRNIGTTSHDIYGARVTTGGVVSDTNGIAICTNSASQIRASAAASGSGYWVVWEDERDSATTSSDIYGARVTTAGMVSDPNGITICTNSASQTRPAVAASGSGYFVVWQDGRTNANPGQHIYGSRLTTAGVVSEGNGVAICTSTNDQLSPAVAASSSGYLVVWQDTRNAPADYIYAARVTTAGVVLDTNGVAISPSVNNQYFPAVAASSSGYLVVWQDDRHSGPTSVDLYGARVTTGGAVSDPNGITISTAAYDQLSPAVAASGSDFLVVWQDSRNFATTFTDIYGARVTAAGVLLDTNGIAICTATNSQGSSTVAATSNGYLVVWADTRDFATTGVDIYGARVTTTGMVSDTNGIAINTVTNYQGSPAVAASSAGYLVVWIDERNNPTTANDIYGTRVTTDGVVLETTGIAISTAENNQRNPVVAANSSGYLVAWEDDRNFGTTYRDIYGARVTPDGFVSETNGIPICTLNDFQEDPTAAAAGDGYVVVWRDVTSQSLFWHRLNSAGQLLESTPLTINGSYERNHAAAAYGGAGRFLLTSDASRSAGIQVASRVIGSLHAINRPSPGAVIEFQAGSFTVLEDKAVATIIVMASGHNAGLVAVDYATADGTAVDGTDYEGQSDTLFFPKRSKQQTFTIPIAPNTTHEADRTVNLVLSNPTGGATLGLKRRAVLTIRDDDAAGAISFSASAYTVRESTHTLTITVKRISGTASGVTVAYETGGGIAVAGSDYTSQAGTLSFEASELSKTFTIPILDNVIKEGKKTFFVYLFNPTGGGTLGPVTTATATILDDD